MAGSLTGRTPAASIAVILSVVTLMAVLQKHSAVAQSSCSSALVSLSPCLNYITGNGTTPSNGCCSALASVVKNNAPCLCQVLTGNNPLGIPVNQTRALALPVQCKVSTPPISQCQGSGAPTTSPTATIPRAPTTSPSGSGSGSPTTQANTGSNPTQTNAASGIFITSVVNVVSVVVAAAVLS